MAKNQAQLGFENMSDGYELRTKSGERLDVAASALQKAIRRGREEEAMFWALDLADSFPNYVWKRLAVIASEDIGLVNNEAAVLVSALWANWQSIQRTSQKGVPVEADLLVHAVLYLARSPKNREVDEAKNYMEEIMGGGWKPDIPDYALDVHTREGRAAGAREGDWWKEGTKLHPASGTSRYHGRVIAYGADATAGPVDESVHEAGEPNGAVNGGH